MFIKDYMLIVNNFLPFATTSRKRVNDWKK